MLEEKYSEFFLQLAHYSLLRVAMVPTNAHELAHHLDEEILEPLVGELIHIVQFA